MPRQVADRLLVPGERVERGGQRAQQRVLPAFRGERDLDGPDRLGVLAVDHGSLVAAEGPDAVARAEEREVLVDHPVEQPAQIGLDPPLDHGLRGLRVAGVKRAATEQDARPVAQVDGAQRTLLQPDAAQVALVEPGEPDEQLVLAVCGGILGAGSQQQERLHKITLVGPGGSLRLVTPLGARQAVDQRGGFSLHVGGQVVDVAEQGRIRDQPHVQRAGQGYHRDTQSVVLADLGERVQRADRDPEHTDGTAGSGDVRDVQREGAGVGQDVLGEAVEPRGVREPPHDRVEVLGVVLLLADHGGVPDGGEAFERVSGAERQVEAEERIPVARLGAVIPEADRNAILNYLTKNFGPEKGAAKPAAKKSGSADN